MTQVVLFFCLHVVGLAVCLAWGPRRYPVVCSALAFPIGLAIAATLALVSVYASLPLLTTVVGGSGAILAPGIWVARGRWRLGRLDLAVLGAGGVAFVGVVALFTIYDATFLTYESERLILTARTFGAAATSLDLPLLRLLSEAGPLAVAAYGLAGLGDIGFLQALQPTLLACVVAAVAAIAGRGAALLGAPRWAGIAGSALGAAALLFHTAVLHSGLCAESGSFVPAYVTCFLGVWWLAETDDDATMIPAALLGLLALFLVSDMAAFLGLALFAVVVLPSRLADRDLDVPVGAAVAVSIAWLTACAIDFPDDDAKYFTATEAQWLLVGLLAVYVVWVAGRADSIRRVVRLLPSSLLAVAAAVTIVGIIAGVGGLDAAAASAASGLDRWGWSPTWPLLIILVLAGLIAGRMPGERLFASVLPICGLLALWVGDKRAFFAPPFGDLQMLATDAFAIASLHLLLKAGWVLGGARAAASEGAPSGRPGRELGIAGVSLLAGLLVFNLHLIDVRDSRFRTYRLKVMDTDSIVDVARRGGRKSRFQYAVYFLVAERTHGGSLRLPPHLAYHESYFRDLAGLQVTQAPASLPSSAMAALRPQVDESWKFDFRRGDVHEIHFIWGQGVRDWVLAMTPDGGPVFWMPLDLYLKVGGTP